MTHQGQSECRPVCAFWGRRRERESRLGHRREGCLHASTYRYISQTHWWWRFQTTLTNIRESVSLSAESFPSQLTRTQFVILKSLVLSDEQSKHKYIQVFITEDKTKPALWLVGHIEASPFKQGPPLTLSAPNLCRFAGSQSSQIFFEWKQSVAQRYRGGSSVCQDACAWHAEILSLKKLGIHHDKARYEFYMMGIKSCRPKKGKKSLKLLYMIMTNTGVFGVNRCKL